MHEALERPQVHTNARNRPDTHQVEIPTPTPPPIPCMSLWTHRNMHTCCPSLLCHMPHRAAALPGTRFVVTSKGKEEFMKASRKGLLAISSRGPHTSVSPYLAEHNAKSSICVPTTPPTTSPGPNPNVCGR